MKNEIAEIRVALMARALDLEALGIDSRERACAMTACQTARLLLGDTLRTASCATPYPKADNPETVGATTKDATEPDYDPELPAEQVEAVKEIRRRIQLSIDALTLLHGQVGGVPLALLEGALVQTWIAKNWLGMDLARLAHSPGVPAGAIRGRQGGPKHPFPPFAPPIRVEHATRIAGKAGSVAQFPSAKKAPAKGSEEPAAAAAATAEAGQQGERDPDA